MKEEVTEFCKNAVEGLQAQVKRELSETAHELEKMRREQQLRMLKIWSYLLAAAENYDAKI